MLKNITAEGNIHLCTVLLFLVKVRGKWGSTCMSENSKGSLKAPNWEWNIHLKCSLSWYSVWKFLDLEQNVNPATKQEVTEESC